MRLFPEGWRLWSIALLTVLALVGAIACGGDGGRGSSGGLAADQTLRVALNSEPDYIDPSIADFATAVTISKNVFATLLRFDPTSNRLHPYVAVEVPSRENGSISEDGLTYTFKLRQDAVWEDGQPLTAQDFVYALQRLLDPRVGSYYGTTFYNVIIEGGAEFSQAVDADDAAIEALRQGVAVRAVDNYTLEIRLSQPTNTFNLLMSLWPTAALRQDVIERYGDIANSSWTEAGNLVASGPFRLAEWDHGSRIVLERNPNFWDQDLTPTLERIVFQIIEDENTAFAAYKAGQVDIAEVPLASLRNLSEDSELRRVPLVTTFALAFNHTRPPFDDLEARKRFCQGIDRETFVNEVQQGRGNPTTSWLPPSLVPYFVAERGQELAFIPDSVREPASNPRPPTDVSSSVKLTYANVGPNATRAEFLQGQWKRNLDIDVGLDPLDGPAFGEAYFTGNYDIAFVGFGEDYHHPENWLLFWKSDGGLNTGGYSNPQFDATVDAATAEEDPQEAVKLWRQAEEILIDQDVAVCALFNGEMAWLVKPYVRDLVMTGADGLPGDFFYWKTAILER